MWNMFDACDPNTGDVERVCPVPRPPTQGESLPQNTKGAATCKGASKFDSDHHMNTMCIYADMNTGKT